LCAQHGNGGRTAVQQIAAFASKAKPSHLTPEARALLKRNILDSVGCVIAALPGASFRALRNQFEGYRSAGSCTLIGGGTTSVEQAALYNSGLVRYVDLLDSYMSPGGLCHPGDNFSAVLATAERVKASGQDFLLALAVAYEVQCPFYGSRSHHVKGFNHGLQLTMPVSLASGKLFGLTELQIANAVLIAAVDNVSLSRVHFEPVSQWKGFSPGITAMRAVYAASLAPFNFDLPLVRHGTFAAAGLAPPRLTVVSFTETRK